MKSLTKKYRVVYRGHIIILDPYHKYSSIDETKIGEDTQSAEFDIEEQVADFLEVNKLSYDLM